MKREIVIPAVKVADYHWHSIKVNNPDRFQAMQRELELHGDRLAYGFNENFEPISCYVSMLAPAAAGLP